MSQYMNTWHEVHYLRDATSVDKHVQQIALSSLGGVCSVEDERKHGVGGCLLF